MKRVNIICGVLMLLVAVVVAFGSVGNPYWDNFAPGPSFMPYWIAAFGVVVALVLIVSAFQQTGEDVPVDFSDGKMAGSVIVLLVAFFFLIPWLGILLGGAVMMLVILVALLRRPIGYSILTVVVTTAILYGVFDYWLQLDLPKSVLGV
jgi:putative tricarboxylic transport membrane protein